jgi:putative flavoprotein involved in K+ transport
MLDFVVIGAGQAGLAIGKKLKDKGYNFLILDSSKEIGASWLKRWDSLKLFTPTEFNHLDGLPFPMKDGEYPDKYEVANYFKSYVSHFNLPLQLNTLVKSLEKKVETFFLETSQGELQAKAVVVATGPFHTPFTPKCSTKVNDNVLQLHSKQYLSTDQLQEGDALVVGGGDSGFQILEEVANTGRKVYFSGPATAQTIPQQFLGKTLWWWFDKLGFLKVNKYSYLGKKLSKTMQPIIGTDVKGILAKSNVTRVERTSDANEEEIIFGDRAIKGIKNIIWSTGFRPNFSWIKNIQLDEEGYPKNFRGITETNGLFFLGLPWMYTRGSATLGGVCKDADYLMDKITEDFSTTKAKVKENKSELA